MITKQTIQDWVANRKALYLKHAELAKYMDSWSEEYRGFNSKWFTNKDLENISYRTINYWDEKGYLTGERKAGSKWRKFDFFQLLWIQLLDKCRHMGITIDNFVPSLFNAFGYIQNLEEDLRIALEKELDENLRKEFHTMLGNATNFQSTFRFWVLYAIFVKKQVSVRYNSDAKCYVTTKNDDSPKYESKSFISISINELITDFLANKSIEVIGDVEILSDNEIEILKIIRENDVSELTVFKQDGTPTRIESKTFVQNIELNKRMYEYLQSPYEKIELVTNGGKVASFIRTKKIKLK